MKRIEGPGVRFRTSAVAMKSMIVSKLGMPWPSLSRVNYMYASSTDRPLSRAMTTSGFLF
jgi:hypothetical protein